MLIAKSFLFFYQLLLITIIFYNILFVYYCLHPSLFPTITPQIKFFYIFILFLQI